MDIRHTIRKLLTGMGLGSLIRPILYTSNTIKYIKKYSFARSRSKNVFFFYIDPSIGHPGLADRLKAIVSCFDTAEKNGYDYKLVFKYPFKIEDYLEPNVVDWLAEEQDIDYSIFDTRFFNYKGEESCLLQNKQYVCFNYEGSSYLSGESWYKAFNKLFKPSTNLTFQLLATGFHEKEYVAAHLRFVNALDYFEKGDTPPLTVSKQEELIGRCKQGIMSLYEKFNGKEKILVFSDSKRFLNEITDLPVYVLDGSSIGHISYNTKNDAVMKTFIDFFMISRSREVYRFLAPEMYKTNFSLIAAQSGGVEFYDINI